LQQSAQSKADLDYLQFQYTQLEEAKLKDGEQEELEGEQEKHAHAEEIKYGLTLAASLLHEEGQSVMQQLKEALSSIQRISRYLPEGSQIANRLESAFIEIKDLALEIGRINDQLHHDPERMAQVSERLNLIYSLEKKHRVSTLSELLEMQLQFEKRINQIDSYDTQLPTMEKELTSLRDLLAKYAEDLHHQRRKASQLLESQVTTLLREVGLPHAAFGIHLKKQADFTESGTDLIQFLFTANKNTPMQDIARVASGGELSRLMLCVKSLMSDATGLPTIVFDEIDTGVSGEIAEKVGNIIHRMSEKMQIINITHLPQVASKGMQHYLVYKTDHDKASATSMKLLSADERLVEIAKMLSGEEVTEAAIQNARVLLGYQI
jgi:DNA repair protein RecN (Recombination protein N)